MSEGIMNNLRDIYRRYVNSDYVATAPLLGAAGIVGTISYNQRSVFGILVAYVSTCIGLISPLMVQRNRSSRELDQLIEPVFLRLEEMTKRNEIREYLDRELSKPPRPTLPMQLYLFHELEPSEFSQPLSEHEIKQLPDTFDGLVEIIQREGLSPALIEIARKQPMFRTYIIDAAINAGFQPKTESQSTQ